MDTITQTKIWSRTLAQQDVTPPDTDSYSGFRSRLRQALINFREHVSVLTDEIPQNLKQLTVHDISHVDALWQVADMIVGPNYPLTPTEAFVLGGAFLLHDLGMALASYPGGTSELEEDPRWRDAAFLAFRRKHGRLPSLTAPLELSPDIRLEATEQLLRLRHAHQAERLATIGYQHTARDSVYFLIDDVELRKTYGPLIGRIAYSHWWSVQELPGQFDKTIGAYPGGPPEWTIDPLKLALILRVSDACHLDARRAPGFLRALRKPTGESERHWRFQEYVQAPFVENRQVVFTATMDTPLEDVDCWWLGYELISLADCELHLADTMLRETGRPPFAAHAVVGANDPARLARQIPTCGWKPIATKLQVNDVAGLVRNLGGRGLYGDNAGVPLRELIQNARDAVVARRIKEGRERSWGCITVRLLDSGDRHKLEVQDSGLGMSDELLVGPFLDFGTSYWNSALMLHENPGLIAKGFQPQGRFGIGFYSVFIWGEHVKVVTRRPEEGIDATRVIEFRKGLSNRPVLRPADRDERMFDAGTIVHVWLDSRATDAGGMLAPGPIESFLERRQRREAWSLKALCTWLCPALDVDLFSEQDGKREKSVVGSEWETMDPAGLLRRLILHRDDVDSVCTSDQFIKAAANVRDLRDENGQLLGRGAFRSFFHHSTAFVEDPLNHASVVTAGSFRASHQVGIVGLLLGDPSHASRFAARPVAVDCPAVMTAWATEQADLVPRLSNDLRTLVHYALLVRLAGGDTNELAIARRTSGLCSFNDIASTQDLPDELELRAEYWDGAGFESPPLPGNSIAVGTGRQKALYFQVDADPRKRADHPHWRRYWMSLWGAAIEAIARAWGVPLSEVLESSEILSDPEEHFVDERGRPCFKVRADIIRKPRGHGA